MRKLLTAARYCIALAKEALFSLGVWSPLVPPSLDGLVTEFVRVNQAYWSAKMPQRSGVLVEGHLSQYGPNYLLRTAVAAKAVQEKGDLDIEVVFNGLSFHWVVAKQMYESFQIRNFIYLDRLYLLSNFGRLIASRIFAARVGGKLRCPEDILNIEYDGIRVGDLIYDDILKLTGRKTIERIDLDVVRAIAKSYYFYLQYQALFRDHRYDYYVSTHTAYSEYGILCRVALSHGVRIIETTDIQMAFFNVIARDNLPTYHEGIRNSILRELGNPRVEVDQLRNSAMASLQRRLASQVNQIDAEKAFRGKVYSRDELIEALDLAKNHKVVFVLAHVFSDAPHLSTGMLHADYYQWLQSTLRVCSLATDVQWIVKPHPSASIYGEEGFVEEMVKTMGSENLFICPRDLNTKSLSTCADAIVTVHGTAGLEFSCLGIPAVLAGKPFYSGFGFTLEPRSRAEYESVLRSLGRIGPLTGEQVDRALEVYAIWDRQFDWNNPIITSDVLANVWGSGQPRNLEKAYSLITKNLRASDPRALKLWHFAQSVVG